MQTMDSRIGLDFIVENPEYIGKLAAALDTNTVAVKKQVVELLSALCVHNEEGHARALDTLDHYRKIKGERYRLSLIVKELDHATAVDYQTALVAFINCLIISTRRLADRARLRNEFIGCHLLPVLSHLRKCAEAEPELAVQLDVFDEQRESDDVQGMQGPHGVDLNSPLDVFYAILKQVADTPQEIPFLSILQHLLRIDSKEAVSDIIWDTAERLVHRASLLENRDDAARLLRAPSVQTKLYCHCQHRNDSISGRRQSLNTPLSPPPGPPPPPPFLGPSFPPPPPPPPNIIPPAPMYTPPPAPSLPTTVTVQVSAQSSPMEIDPVNEKLPQQEIPTPKIKMKTINWNKIPSNKVIGKNNIWTQVAYGHQHSPMADIDWSEMEDLFCQQIPQSAQSSPKLAKRDSVSGDTLERRMRKDTTEVTLLDGKRSLNVNIFLKQFRSSNDEIVSLIKNGDHDEIGAEKLRGLLKILPEIDELDMLKSFNGDFNRLGNAEKFLTQLTNLSNFKLRIESMLLKEEFASNMNYLEPSINSMMIAANDLMTNQPLQEVLYMILVAGNFLNSGGYAGNAAGVKLSSLQKITDIRANKPNMNLMHYVAMQAEKRDRKLLLFAENVGVLEEAAKNTVEQLHNEINALDVRIRKIKKQIDLPTTEPEIKFQMNDFLQMAEHEVSNLQQNMVQLENVRKQLTDFFCEEVNSFKLEECFRIFHGIYIKFRQAVAENVRRRLQEEQANARRKQREELIATKRRQMGSLGSSADSGNTFNDTQIYDAKTGFLIKKGRKAGSGSNVASEEDLSIAGSPSVTRRRLGSFNGQHSGDTTPSITGREEKSPDITPNGSLRRRRSRVLSEEDEGNLMEFLRASGSDNNRERKSWGSLDRSWARRARGSSTRKRPALLGADFSLDRERPSSPSPLAESKPFPNSEDESKPKEWKQKIECWLQSNESDSPGDESRRQARRLTNRRSLEMDSESERSSNLETLPEGKQVYSGGQSNYRRVYPDWTPSTAIDTTDVVSAMEVVEEVQPPPKDKSAWRKSNLNVSNSTEATMEDTSSRNWSNDRDLNSRKELISALGAKPASDHLTLYIRSADDHPPDQNKVDIDQDNIETPPAVRRVFTSTPTEKREVAPPTPCRRLMGRPKDAESENIGDGQFDRFSAARRTRRYKRTSESVTEVQPETLVVKPVSMLETSVPVEFINPPEVDKESRLKIWQNRLKIQEPVKRNRHQTGIDQEDVKKALKLGVSSPIDIKVSPREVRKIRENDNDEGFEETQSLMSESPSQGASSGGNYDVDIVDANVVIAGYIKSNENVNPASASSPKKMIKSAVQKPIRPSEQVRPIVCDSSKTSVIPRRSSGVRKIDVQAGILSKRNVVERSNSRNSLVSSRSSLNSATSTNTVKRIPLKATNSNSISSKSIPTGRTLSSNASKANLIKRSSTSSMQVTTQRPPRPQMSSFMKPTAASSTKTNVLPSRLQQPNYRSKN